MNLYRIRIGCAITALIGVMYCAVGLFESLAQVALGAIIAAGAVIGYGLVDYLEARRDEEIRLGRAAVWARRDGCARPVADRRCGICVGLWSPWPCPHDRADEVA